MMLCSLPGISTLPGTDVDMSVTQPGTYISAMFVRVDQELGRAPVKSLLSSVPA